MARPWLAKASFSSITSKSDCESPSRAISFLRGRRRAKAHDARRHAGGCAAQNAGDRRQTMRLDRRLGGEDQRRRAVIDARGIAGRDRAAVAERRAQLGQRLQRGIGARMFVGVDDCAARPCAAG